jgi:N-acetylneuraminic acid mutarotase
MSRMIPSVSIFAGLALLAMAGCGGGGSKGSPSSPITPPSTPSSASQWIWQGGPDQGNQAGIYGTKGTAAASNIPGGRESAVSWTDASGDLWLFGGSAAPTSTEDQFFNDLWKFSDGKWTWMSGSKLVDQPGTYGSLGVASPDNAPGARTQAVGWTDKSGDFWLFGGIGRDAFGDQNDLNDLWRYSHGQWTWMSGSNTGNQTQWGIYGTKGEPASDNIPGARESAVGWTDKSGDLWLFGGVGYDSVGAWSYLNDLWKYSGGQWTWMGGSKLANQAGTYGTQGTAAAENTPGARSLAVTWTDAAGDFWLFGGSPGPNGQFNIFNDLWKYSGGQWTWMAGSDNWDQSGSYGTQGVAAAGNSPGARVSSLAWIDASGDLWLFGGDGYDLAGEIGLLNDLWKFSNGKWQWVAGPDVENQPASYGILGTAASGNLPGGRSSSVTWIDSSANLWLFGGYGYDADGSLTYLSDLWECKP